MKFSTSFKKPNGVGVKNAIAYFSLERLLLKKRSLKVASLL